MSTDGPSATLRSERRWPAALAVLVLIALPFLLELADDLIHGGPVTQSATELLSTGALVWLNNNIIFGFHYWELDGGGPAARAHDSPAPDFALPRS